MRQITSASRRSVRYDVAMTGSNTQQKDAVPPVDWSLWELDEEEDMGMTPEHVRVAIEIMGSLSGSDKTPIGVHPIF